MSKTKTEAADTIVMTPAGPKTITPGDGAVVLPRAQYAALLAQRDKLLEAAKLALDGLFALGVGGVGCCDTDKDIKANADRCIREAREIHVALREAIKAAKE